MQKIWDRAGPPRHSRIARLAVLPSKSITSSASQRNDFAGRYLAYTSPCQRFADALADTHA